MRFTLPAFPFLLAATALAGCANDDSPTAANTPGGVQFKVTGINGQIAFDRNGEIVLTANPDGSNIRELVSPSCCPRWSPDGSKLTGPASTEFGTISFATFNPDGSDYTPMPIDDPTLNVALGIWSPDGERVAGEGWDDTEPSRNGVYTRRAADGGGLFRVTTNPFGGHDIPGDYSPGGSRIIFVRGNSHRSGNRARGGNSAVFVVNTDGSDLRRITPWGMAGCCTASWSPDGQWILFDARGSLFVIHPDGTGLRRTHLHPDSRYSAYEPAWSPDGKRIVFGMYLVSAGQDDIFTAKADGTDLVQVTNTPEHEGQPDWGPHQN